ncbi:MAG TPA: hypothetical protein PLU30_00275 [Verrucomicrobiae bacterium]|nr:hypothetical protein [Verrucomicrobiae bacterium]
MSETRNTTTIEEIDVPPSEPLISLGEVISAVGWVTFQATKLAVKGAVVGGVLAYRGGKALAGAIQESRHRASLPEIREAIASSATARDAVLALATNSGLDVTQSEASALTARLESLVARNDRAGVQVVARELVVKRQTRMQAQLLPIIAQSCQSVGFTPTVLEPGDGLLVATRPGTRQSLAIEVAKVKDGGVQIHFDANGFTGGACAQTLDALQAELRARGVRCDLRARHRKHSQPAFDHDRIDQRLYVRSAN